MESRDARAPERTAEPRSDPIRLARWVAIAAAVVGTDQVTKILLRANLAEGEAWPYPDAWFAISHVENSGAAFGMFQGAGIWLLAVTVLGVSGLLFYVYRYPPQHRLYVMALALILGGAIGNLIDRAMKGSVTDFLDPRYYPAFNIADSAIVIGVGAIIMLSFLEARRQQ